MLLMCRNTPVYDVDKQQVLSEKHLPGIMLKNPCNRALEYWQNTRYSSSYNMLAHQIKQKAFGSASRKHINNYTRQLSLSDSYWFKNANEQITFEEVSPYFVDFWTGLGEYTNNAIPTLYVPGCLSKEWMNKDYLIKYGGNPAVENQCICLCKYCGIPVNNCSLLDNNQGIIIENFTSIDYFLEQSNQSGILSIDNFTSEDIIYNFGIQGIQMITIDAITGNGDRHSGNFGWIRSTETGEYLGMSPLYDFDHGLDSKKPKDILINDLLKIITSHKEEQYKEEVYRVASMAMGSSINTIFNTRANVIYNMVKYL